VPVDDGYPWTGNMHYGNFARCLCALMPAVTPGRRQHCLAVRKLRTTGRLPEAQKRWRIMDQSHGQIHWQGIFQPVLAQ
jgi:hypothetical protein